VEITNFLYTIDSPDGCGAYFCRVDTTRCLRPSG
jgi:hypothetical protein